mmetsp:Transcript_108037/g.304365  ORF Transcript_108037/g.304365 Transcript_108037/m.304365 type:complete len:301 (-) Transcript_108037:161-1063(-)
MPTKSRSSSRSSARGDKEALLKLLRACSETPSRSRSHSTKRNKKKRSRSRPPPAKAPKKDSREEKKVGKRFKNGHDDAREEKKALAKKPKGRSRSRSRSRRRKSSPSSSNSGHRGARAAAPARKSCFDDAARPEASAPTGAPTDVAMAEAIRRAQLKAATNLQNNAPSVPPDMRPGDWFCSVCSTHNYSTRPMCFRCRHGANPGRGVAAAAAAAVATAQGGTALALTPATAGFTGLVPPGGLPTAVAATALVAGVAIGGIAGGGTAACGDFRRGHCSRGDRCRYSHNIPATIGASTLARH